MGGRAPGLRPGRGLPAAEGRRGVTDRIRRDAPLLLLAAGLTVSAVLISVWQSKLTFAFDDWDFLLGRLGSSADVFLVPHHEHISIAPVVIYKTLLSVFGLSSPRPFQVVSVCLFLAVLVVVFVYLRRRVGGWLALAGVLPMLFFGPAWDNVMWSFQIGFTGSLAAGVGALLALDREDERGDLAACVLLTVGMTFSSLWLPFTIGAAVHVLTATGRLRRAYVFAVPGVLWALWWLGWGHEAESAVSFNNLATIPQYVLEGLASSLNSLVGLRGLEETDGNRRARLGPDPVARDRSAGRDSPASRGQDPSRGLGSDRDHALLLGLQRRERKRVPSSDHPSLSADRCRAAASRRGRGLARSAAEPDRDRRGPRRRDRGFGLEPGLAARRVGDVPRPTARGSAGSSRRSRRVVTRSRRRSRSLSRSPTPESLATSASTSRCRTPTGRRLTLLMSCRLRPRARAPRPTGPSPPATGSASSRSRSRPASACARPSNAGAPRLLDAARRRCGARARPRRRAGAPAPLRLGGVPGRARRRAGRLLAAGDPLRPLR